MGEMRRIAQDKAWEQWAKGTKKAKWYTKAIEEGRICIDCGQPYKDGLEADGRCWPCHDGHQLLVDRTRDDYELERYRRTDRE